MTVKTLKNNYVLITGASSGLGEMIAYEAAKKNASLILCARNMEKLKKVASISRAMTTGKVLIQSLDISDYNSVEQLMTFIEENELPIDVLVNNAGVGIFKPFLETSQEEIDMMFSVNILGLMTLTQKVAVTMAENKKGHIINIASQAGKMATPKSSVYAATKFAVIGWSNALRLELKPFGIKVLTVNPGPMRTNFFDTADPTGDYLKQVSAFVTEPERLAKKVVNTIGSNRREINTPWMMEVGSIGYTLFPRVGDFLTGGLFNKK